MSSTRDLYNLYKASSILRTISFPAEVSCSLYSARARSDSSPFGFMPSLCAISGPFSPSARAMRIRVRSLASFRFRCFEHSVPSNRRATKAFELQKQFLAQIARAMLQIWNFAPGGRAASPLAVRFRVRGFLWRHLHIGGALAVSGRLNRSLSCSCWCRRCNCNRIAASTYARNNYFVYSSG